MSQSEIEEHLKNHPDLKFTADELRRFLDINTSVYSNLQKIRKGMNCDKCLAPVRGDGDNCVYCGWKLEPMIRCELMEPKHDSRSRVYFYWWKK